MRKALVAPIGVCQAVGQHMLRVRTPDHRVVAADEYWHARRLTFLMSGTYHKLEWLRMVGDLVFLFAGALPITLGALRSVWKRDLSPTA